MQPKSDPLPSKINIGEERGDEKEEKIATLRSPSRKKEKRSENSKMREFEILAQKGGVVMTEPPSPNIGGIFF